MQVIIDGLQAGNLSGTGRHTVELLRALAQLPDTPDILCLWPKGLPTATVQDTPRFRFQEHAAGGLQRFLAYQTTFPQRARAWNNAVLHFPANIGALRRVRHVVLTVHDVSFLHHPEWFSRNRAAYYRFAVSRSARIAERIIAVSQWTADEISEWLGVSPDRIDVIHNGVSERFKPASADAVARLRNTLTLPDRFFIYVGTLEPRKNVPALIEAYSRCAREIDLDLVIAGRRGWKTEPIDAALARSDAADRIHFTGHVDDADMPTLLTAAHALVWPSLFEGFGLPPLEAMACGTPVITSTTSSLPEIVGDAALSVDPGDIEALAANMLRLARDTALHADLRARGQQRAAPFTWRRAAEQTIATYARTCG